MGLEMYPRIFTLLFILIVTLTTGPFAATAEDEVKRRFVVVDSYHREYLWSQHVNDGFCRAMLQFGYLDNPEQISVFTRTDQTTSSKAIIRRLWMDTKRQTAKDYLAKTTADISKAIQEFKPDLIFLGDDNAANYIGNQFLDSKIPVVFWGVNNTPVKYGLVDNIDRPGHNVTGVYQKTYYYESLQLLRTLAPQVRTFAVLSDDTTTGRIHNKAIAYLNHKSQLPLKLVTIVATNSLSQWKQKALELQNRVDAFFIASSNGLRDENGLTVSNEEVARWYLKHIKIPEAAGFRYRVELGWLCAADDSGFNQGYEAVSMAHDILTKGLKPSDYPPRAPPRGPLLVNKERARFLGISLGPDMGIEEIVGKSAALKSRIIVANSYHKGYFASEEALTGFVTTLRHLAYYDNPQQLRDFYKNDYVETSTAVLKKVWLDSKRRNSKDEMLAQSSELYKEIKSFFPDIIVLGDDNAVNYIGKKFLGVNTPVVFWGLNNSPLKYGLVRQTDQPGYNVTGVYQRGYYEDSLRLLKKMVPQIETFAILSDQTPSGRSHCKKIEHFARKGVLPLKHVETVSTNSFAQWKDRALKLQKHVDAFYVAQFSSLKDERGNPVPLSEVMRWYLSYINIPEATGFRRFVSDGLLCASDDSFFNQGAAAASIVHDILQKGMAPSTYAVRAPVSGRTVVNRKRARMLGITLTAGLMVDEYID